MSPLGRCSGLLASRNGVSDMIELMEIIALVIGVVIGLYWYRGTAEYMLTLLYLLPFRTKDTFELLYDHADDEVTFAFIGDSLESVKKYSDFYRLHKAARPLSFKYFQKYYEGLKSVFFSPKALLVLVPAIAFWTNWYLYLIGVVLSLVGIIVYKLVQDGQRAGLYQRLIVLLVIESHQKAHTKKSK